MTDVTRRSFLAGLPAAAVALVGVLTHAPRRRVPRGTILAEERVRDDMTKAEAIYCLQAQVDEMKAWAYAAVVDHPEITVRIDELG